MLRVIFNTARKRRMIDPKVGEKTKFSSTNQPKNNGRKPSQLRKFLKDNNLSSIDIQIIASNFTNLTVEQLAEYAIDKTKPILVSGVARALLEDYKHGKTDSLKWLIDRAFGAAKQTIEHSGSFDITTMSHEQRHKRIEELEKKRRERENKE